ncbi:RNA U transporter 1 [Aphelenchoides fujianensis]|nr:RNA U transporter 1 [Aphelenchoides fujianensis]
MTEPNAAAAAANDADVDTLIDAFSADVEVSLDYDRNEHPRYAQYKNYGRLAENQRSRRADWMEKQRQNRQEKLNVSRGLGTSEPTAAADEEPPTAEMNDAAAPVDYVVEDVEMEAGGVQWGGQKKPRNRRRNHNSSSTASSWSQAFNQRDRVVRKDLIGRLMYSEWLIDVPADFEREWLMHEAEVFNKLGERRDRFGCPSVGKTPIMLDAITTTPHGKNGKKIYIIDLVHSDFCDSAESDFEFRRFMLQSYIEKGDLLTAPNSGGVSFELLPAIPCSKDELEKFMAEPTPYGLDGLMFYHKEAFYTGGETPMVGWLKPWMMSDVLGVGVHATYEKKSKAITQQEYIDKFAKNHPSYAKPVRRHQSSESTEQPPQPKDAPEAAEEAGDKAAEEMQ